MVSDRDRYVSAAIEHGRCTESGDFRKGNAAFDRETAALKKLRQNPDKGEAVLLELLTHPNDWVKLASATHLLPLHPDLASSVLEELAARPQGLLEFGADMVLREWRAGRLQIP